MISYRNRAYRYLILVAIIWGVAGAVIKYTLGGIDPLPFLAYRFTISALFSLAFFCRKIHRGKKFKQFRANFALVAVYGLLAAPIALGILFYGLKNSTVLDLTLVGVIGPLIVTAGGALFFRDTITKKERVGILIVITGVLLNSFYPLMSSTTRVALSGNILLLAFLITDASSVLIAKRVVRKKVKSANITNMAFIIGAIVLVPLTALIYGPRQLASIIITLPLKYHFGVWYMAIASGTLAYFLYVRAQRSIEVSEAVLFNYLQPVFMIPLAVFWLKEKITFSFIIGAALIALGIFIAEHKKKKGQS